eukprot:TRINITY_DN171_c0_g1_i1.p1 TRINITY_DN171_c0_g1~~TRINITY_DN171_c0_g1_i1.p1  ORF type:complete len:666 (-),score=165.26 TRINITY_DN171_c0_g1_i1:706-2703(-)
MARVIVVGGGLSGLSAAHTVLERGANVLVLDKNPFLGGNSTKATSGINGALTRTQVKLGVKDSAEAFYDDTARSARNLIRPGLVKVLTYNSASAVEWLQDKFDLDLSLVSQLGGHSFPRTHRGKERFPGMTITYALMEKLEDLAKTQPSRVQIVKKARVTRLVQDETGRVVGVEYEFQGKTFTENGTVVLATGGYAADFAENGLIKKYRPDVFDLPTTNGDWSTGDGIKMVTAIGGNAVDLEKVQVHPTGLVDPSEPDAKLKFLAAEALRGVGGLLLDSQGKRFCDELGHRDYVTGEMWKNKGPFRLVLNGAASKEIEWHCKHYMGRGLMKKFNSGEALAKEMGISVQALEQTFSSYNNFAKNKNDPFGKKFFHNLPFGVNDEFYVAFVTPVVHYCMGGLEISPESEVMGKNGPISGLFACGELGGGVHGANRLGGSSLLGCVVYGRVAGDSACKDLFQNLAAGNGGNTGKRIASLSNQLSGTSISGDQIKFGATFSPSSRKLTLEVEWSDQGVQVSSAQGASPSRSVLQNEAESTRQFGPVGPSAVPGASTSTAADSVPTTKTADKTKEYTLEEVAKHNTEKDCWVVVNGEVLDATNFLKDHPGGKKAILLYAGKDASEEFNMLHKPDVVEKYAPEIVIGKLKGATTTPHVNAPPQGSKPVSKL